MADPFESRRSGAGVLSRVVPGQRRSTAIQEIESLLAKADRITGVEVAEIEMIGAVHGVDLRKRCRTARVHLYRRFFEYCLTDHALSTDESEDLAHLAVILCIDDADADRVHDEIARRVYGAAIDSVLDDQQLDPDEEEFLNGLQKNLQIPGAIAQALLAEGVQRARQRFFSRTAGRSGVFLTSQEAPLQLVGASQDSIEAAVGDALGQACRAVPRLHWVEVSKIRGEVKDGAVAEWQVELKAWLDPEE